MLSSYREEDILFRAHVCTYTLTEDFLRLEEVDIRLEFKTDYRLNVIDKRWYNTSRAT